MKGLGTKSGLRCIKIDLNLASLDKFVDVYL